VRRLLALIVASLLLTTAACGGGDSGKASSNGGADQGADIPGLRVSGKVGSQPTVKVTKPLKVSSLKSHVVAAGSGPQVHNGDQLQVNLFLANGATGKKLQSTYDTGQAQKLLMSKSAQASPIVAKTFGQHKGTRLVLAGKAGDMFGPNGIGNLKPADTAVLVLDIMSVKTPRTLNSPAGVPSPLQVGSEVVGLDWSHAPQKPPSELKVVSLVKGTGATVKRGQKVRVNYYGAVWQSDVAFDSSYARGTPASFKVGAGSLIKAWDEKIPGLKVGSKVIIIAPPDTAYGSSAQGGIPANSTLAFVVDVVGVDS